MYKMTKTKTKQKKTVKISASSQKMDSVFFLKLLLYMVLGAQWLKFVGHDGNTQVPIPIGMIIGLLFAMHDHFKIDRKIEFAVLLVAMFVGFWSQMGIYIHLA